MGPGISRKINTNRKSVQTLGKSVQAPSAQEGSDTGLGRNKRIKTNGNSVQEPNMQEGSGGKRSNLNANHSQVLNTQGGEIGLDISQSRTRRIVTNGNSFTNGNSVQAPTTHEGSVVASALGGGISGRYVSQTQVLNTQGGETELDISQSRSRRVITNGNSVSNGNSAQAPTTHEGSGGRRSGSDVSQPQVPNTQEGVSSSGTKKNIRKKTVNKKLTEFLRLGGRRPVIEILPHLNVPVGPWAAEWSNELGVIARTLVPLKCRTWKDVGEPQKNTIFEYVLKRFDVDLTDAHVVSAVDGHIKKLFKDYRSSLHSYYKTLPDNIDKTKYPRKDVAQGDWALLCAHWETDAFKKKSETNRKSREGVKILHRAGTRNFARARFDLTNPETNEQPDVVSLYKSMHHSLKKGWIAPQAEENYENMMEMLNQPPEEGNNPLTPDVVRKSVLGVRSGYGCGLGYGYVVPTQRTAAAASAAGAAATAAIREEMEQLRQRAEIAENQLSNQGRMLENAENQLHNQKNQLRNQGRMLEQILSRLGGDYGDFT